MLGSDTVAKTEEPKSETDIEAELPGKWHTVLVSADPYINNPIILTSTMLLIK